MQMNELDELRTRIQIKTLGNSFVYQLNTQVPIILSVFTLDDLNAQILNIHR